MKTIVVTGAAGFLGSHLTRRLLDQGHRVIGLDNLSTGTRMNLDPFLYHPSFTFMQHDVCDRSIVHMPELKQMDEIFHLASPASPKFYQAHPFETMAANTTGLVNMLDLAVQNGAKLLYTSTSEAYGDPDIHPQPEEYRGNVNTWGPRACYDEGKRLGEVYCYEYMRRFQAKVKVARIFNTYSAGLRNDDGRVISNFVTQALSSQDITVFGDGSQTRSFCYVDDNIRGLLLMMEKDEANGQIVNIGSTEEHSVLEVAVMVKRLTGSNSKIVFRPLPEDDPKSRRPVIRKAIQLLNWEPRISLEDGLKRTIEAYKSVLFPAGEAI